jgi:hypothetical protein
MDANDVNAIVTAIRVIVSPVSVAILMTIADPDLMTDVLHFKIFPWPIIIALVNSAIVILCPIILGLLILAISPLVTPIMLIAMIVNIHSEILVPILLVIQTKIHGTLVLVLAKSSVFTAINGDIIKLTAVLLKLPIKVSTIIVLKMYVLIFLASLFPMLKTSIIIMNSSNHATRVSNTDFYVVAVIPPTVMLQKTTCRSSKFPRAFINH